MIYETIIIIPSYNGAPLLDECLRSIRGQSYQNFKTVVADDASTDDSIEYLRMNFPEADILAFKKNHGFAGAVNAALHYSLQKYRPRFIAVLNNDTKVDKNWLMALVRRAKTSPRIAAVTSNMFFYDHPEIINSQGGTLDWNGDGHDINFGVHRNDGKKQSGPVVGACFGASLIACAPLGNIGLLDEMFGAYFEDLDWSWRAHILGYQIIFEKNAIVYHRHSMTYQKTPYRKLLFCKRNALRAAIKNYERKNLIRQLVFIFIGYWFSIVGYFQTNKHQLPLRKKIVYTTIPLLSLFWNLVHLPSAMRERRVIQRKRKKKDNAVLDLARQDSTPVRKWIKELKSKVPGLPGKRNINRYLPEHALRKNRGLKSFSARVNEKTMDVYFRDMLINLPFSFADISRKDVLKEESTFVIDACMSCLQLSWYRDRVNLKRLARKLETAGHKLKKTAIHWDKTIAFGKAINAPSQLYFYFRLIEESGTIKFPEDKMNAMRNDGSRLQNMVLDRIHYKKLLSGTPTFFLKLYSKMYLEEGFIKHLTARAHAIWNGEESIKPDTEVVPSVSVDWKPGVNPVRNSPPQRPLGRASAGVISNGVNIFGFLDSESGVGEAARTIARAMERARIPCALLNSPRCPHRRKDNEFSKKFTSVNPYAVNIITFYGDVFRDELHAWGKEKFEGRYNIAYWAWELSRLPDSWEKLLDLVDEVWVPSTFVASAVKNARKKIRLTVIPHAISSGIAPYSRSHFSLDKNDFVFLFMFDFYSIFERKNPLAVIRAFKKAFRPEEPVELIIKCSNGGMDPEHLVVLEEEAKHHRIRIIHEYLSREKINSLLNLCDAYVSLHRSEGFGLTIAEAMFLRKPVIATDYSGNVDFLNKENGFPVPYSLVPLDRDYGPYKKGNVWADPNISEAAKSMRLVFTQREIAMRKAMRAEQTIKTNFSSDATAKLVQKRLEKIFWK